jgi:hypothetical protein
MSKSLFEYRLDILIKEWDYVQTHTGRFDPILFNIRTWAVSAFTALIAVAATQKIPGLMLLAILPALMFWFLDALNKSIQLRFISRGQEIEAYLSSSAFINDAKSQTEFSIDTPGLSRLFRKKKPFFHRARLVLKAAVRWSVLSVYSAMICLCALSYFFLRVTVH